MEDSGSLRRFVRGAYVVGMIMAVGGWLLLEYVSWGRIPGGIIGFLGIIVMACGRVCQSADGYSALLERAKRSDSP